MTPETLPNTALSTTSASEPSSNIPLELYEFVKSSSNTNYSTTTEQPSDVSNIVREDITTTRTEIEIEDLKSTEISQQAGTFSSILEQVTTEYVALRPNKEFWQELKKFYFYGCSVKSKISTLCSLITYSQNSQYSDLSEFESPDTDDFQHMDKKLLEFLKRANLINSLKEVTIENIFNIILYGDNSSPSQKLPVLAENAFRLILCFYIDTLVVDSNFNDTFHKDVENITGYIKSLLIQLYTNPFKIYQRQLIEPNQLEPERTTLSKRSIDDSYLNVSEMKEGCDLLALHPYPKNSIIIGEERNTQLMPDIEQNIEIKVPILVSVSTRINFKCLKGFTLNGIGHTVCDADNKWTPFNFECVCK